MEPAVGSVFAIWVERCGRYGVKQLCGRSDDGSGWWLDLDWFEPEPPSNLEPLEPLGEFGSYVRSKALVPARWVPVGVRHPLRTEEPTTSEWIWLEPAAARRYDWLQHPQAERDAYERAVQSSETVQIDGEAVPLNTWNLAPSSMRAPAEELSQLICVTRVEIDADRPDLAEVLSGFPFLEDVTIWVPLDRVTLPHTVTVLQLWPDASPEMVVRGGSVRRLAARPDTMIELPELTELLLSEIDELDLADVVRRYPRLRFLHLFGSAGTLTEVESLVKLTNLRDLELNDVYGFEALPHLAGLERLTASSIPKAAGVQARKDYADIQLLVHKLRTDAWLADNLGNPFRSWDGSECVPARYFKAAWKAYKAHRKSLRDEAERTAAGELTTAEFHQLVIDTITTVADEFNGWNTSDWIGTEEREQIADAYRVLLGEVADITPVDIDAAMAALDAARDW